MDNNGQRAHLLFPPAPLRAFGDCVREAGTRLKTDSVLVFVCGARSDGGLPTARDAFLEHASIYLKRFRFFRAEDVLSAIVKPNQDILSMEGKLAEFADCIIIILESPGSLAELGAFAYHNKLCRIVMAVNDVAFQNVGSFVSDGPVKRLDRVSRFKPAIYADLSRRGVLSAFTDIEDRLGVISRVKRKRVDIGTGPAFRQCLGKHKILFLSDLIGIFGPLRYEDVIALLGMIYGGKAFSLKMEIALLEAIRLIHNINGFYVRSLDERALFYDFENLNVDTLRAEIFNHYHKYHRERLMPLHNVPRFEE